MRVNFDIHPAAQAEFFDTLRHYAALDEQDQAQPLAAAFDTAFNLHLSLILDNPLLYNLRRPPIRRANLTRALVNTTSLTWSGGNEWWFSPLPMPNATPTTGATASVRHASCSDLLHW